MKRILASLIFPLGQGGAQHRGGFLIFLILTLSFCSSLTHARFVDEKREIRLSGFVYSRAAWAVSNDTIGTYKGNWARGNLVQHRNFASLEWRHNLSRIVGETRPFS